jgi:magnesium transporter
MPSLPRIRRPGARRPAEAAPREHPRAAELDAAGLTWVHLDALDAEEVDRLAQRFGWHPLDVEDVLSKRQRPKIDDYAEDGGYLFAVLHLPVSWTSSSAPTTS